MTVGNLLKKLEIGDQAFSTQRPDGSNSGNLFTLVIVMDNYGNLSRAQVQEATAFSVGMIIKASGTKKHTPFNTEGKS